MRLPAFAGRVQAFRANPRAMAVSAISEPQPQGLVFVVDGDGAVRRSLRFALGIEGLAVETFADAETFLGLGECRPDACLVVDYHLKGMNGIDLIAALRRRECGMPAILTVTNPSPALARQAAAAGVALVEKPLLSSGLLDRIREALAGADAARG